MKMLCIEEVRQLLEETPVAEEVLKELMVSTPDIFTVDGFNVVAIEKHAEELVKRRDTQKRAMLLLDAHGNPMGATFASILFPQISLLADDPRETYWFGETPEERKETRKRTRIELVGQLSNRDNILSTFNTRVDERSFLVASWERFETSAISTILSVMRIRQENAAVDNFLYAVDRKISREKVPDLSTPLKHISDKAGVWQHYEVTQVDAMADPEEKLTEYYDRASGLMRKAMVDLAAKLRDGSQMTDNKNVEKVEWIIVADPLRARYIDLPNAEPLDFEPIVVSTQHLSMKGRAFITPRITYKSGEVQTFGWRLTDLSQLKFEQDERGNAGYKVYYADQLCIAQPIVGELKVSNLRGEVL